MPDFIRTFYLKSNYLDFRVCDSETSDSLHKTYCMHLYGCELWGLQQNYFKKLEIAWHTIKLRNWNLPISPSTQCAIVHNTSYNIEICLDNRLLKCIHSGFYHHNSMCSSVLKIDFNVLTPYLLRFFDICHGNVD